MVSINMKPRKNNNMANQLKKSKGVKKHPEILALEFALNFCCFYFAVDCSGLKEVAHTMKKKL